MSAPTSHREIERKFRVHAMFTWPDLSTVVEQLEEQPTVAMTAVYHDTADLTLFRWKVTLRRREGGADQGWHLKLPVFGAGDWVRDELQTPLESGAIGQIPAELADIIGPLVRAQALTPVVELRTQRTPRIVSNSNGVPLVEIVDDTVTVVDRSGTALAIFRELEIELLDNENPDALDAMDRLSGALLNAGAVPGTMSKAAAALGPRASAPADVPELPMPPRTGIAADAVRSTIAGHVRALIFADVAVRRDLPDAVHQVRVAGRRLRSILRTFDPLLEHEWAEQLEEELAWLATEMGIIRDSEVLEERLIAHSALLPEPQSQMAQDATRTALDRRVEGARSGAMAALRSDRHTYLIEDLISAAREPRLLDDAYQACEDVLPPLVAHAWNALAKSCRKLELEGPPDEWHRARIKAKRARYAVDAVLPVFPSGAVRRFAKSLAEITELLGDHQDAYVAQMFVQELAQHPDTNGQTGFALGLLHAIEVESEYEGRLNFADAWSTTRKAARHSGLL
ncbi:MAG: CYTH and CHAD domain-containing protein [Actinomycetota bacterium]|nr:CYTH and CHAD domain-containing protein [Actinomycetota bacterium]MDP2287017.1 CYTH and CHAD domain-containing protein [Actinomycetota bacterium]